MYMGLTGLEIFLTVSGALLTLIVTVLGYMGTKALDRIDKLERDRAELSERIARIESGKFDEKLEFLTAKLSDIERKLDVICALFERNESHHERKS